MSTARARLLAASQRDELAYTRDLAALARDRAADARDVRMDARERAASGLPAVHHLHDAEQRGLAAGDRSAAAADHVHSARERVSALEDRMALVRQLRIAETDHLTGARARGAGLADLDRELERSRRTRTPLVVAYSDVVGLKLANDALGHAAGDALLQRIVATIRGQMRSYDLAIRLGGDEFLFVLTGVPEPEVRARFEEIRLVLAPSAVTTGFATYDGSEDAAALLARADLELNVLRRTARGLRG